MILTTNYFTKNPYIGDGKFLEGAAFKGFFLHDIATQQPDPNVMRTVFDKENHTNSAINGFIGDREIIITAPCLETPGRVKRMPHACSPANNGYVGFEMCNPATLKFNSNHTKFTVDAADLPAAKAYVAACYQNAVYLFAMLCWYHGKDPLEDGVILSHKEGGKRGIASDHGDPEGLWDGLSMGYTMDGFRNEVALKMDEIALNGGDGIVGYLGFPDVEETDWYADALKWAVEKHIVLSDGGRFNPNNNISNAAFVVRLRRMYNALRDELKAELTAELQK